MLGEIVGYVDATASLDAKHELSLKEFRFRANIGLPFGKINLGVMKSV